MKFQARFVVHFFCARVIDYSRAEKVTIIINCKQSLAGEIMQKLTRVIMILHSVIATTISII